MKTNQEIRAEAREMLKNGWFGRVMAVSVSLYSVLLVATSFTMAVYADMKIATWGDFIAEKAKNAANGLCYTVPSSSVAWSMTAATAFQQLVSFLFAAILFFGVSTVILKAMRNDSSRWFADSLGGFSRPLQLFYLVLDINVRIFLWSLLLFFPGIVAVYRYRLAWYLKCDHPELGAGECIAESSRMMDGHKMRMFELDLHYVLMVVLLLAGIWTTRWLLGLSDAALPVGLFASVFSFFLLWLCVVVMFRWLAARTVFYRELVALCPKEVADDLSGDDR